MKAGELQRTMSLLSFFISHVIATVHTSIQYGLRNLVKLSCFDGCFQTDFDF